LHDHLPEEVFRVVHNCCCEFLLKGKGMECATHQDANVVGVNRSAVFIVLLSLSAISKSSSVQIWQQHCAKERQTNEQQIRRIKIEDSLRMIPSLQNSL
jgi:hypothetical protein